MKRVMYILLIIEVLSLAGCQEQAGTEIGLNNPNNSPIMPNEKLTPNAFGPGIHMNQYGQPVRYQPDFGYIPDEMLNIQRDAYGPGVHIDQYGRPIRENPWP